MLGVKKDAEFSAARSTAEARPGSCVSASTAAVEASMKVAKQAVVLPLASDGGCLAARRRTIYRLELDNLWRT